MIWKDRLFLCDFKWEMIWKDWLFLYDFKWEAVFLKHKLVCCMPVHHHQDWNYFLIHHPVLLSYCNTYFHRQTARLRIKRYIGWHPHPACTWTLHKDLLLTTAQGLKDLLDTQQARRFAWWLPECIKWLSKAWQKYVANESWCYEGTFVSARLHTAEYEMQLQSDDFLMFCVLDI